MISGIQIHRYLKRNTISRTDSELWHGLVIAPFVETLIFCYLPYLLYLKTGKFWEIGIVSSSVFAFMHLRLGRNFVPITFVLGVIFWTVMIKAGFIYVVFLHFLIVLFDLSFGFRRFLAS